MNTTIIDSFIMPFCSELNYLLEINPIEVPTYNRNGFEGYGVDGKKMLIVLKQE